MNLPTGVPGLPDARTVRRATGMAAGMLLLRVLDPLSGPGRTDPQP